ncbi:MAG: adenylate/guanylate cyclase domain-containing protein [Chloroflexota bacterium]
MNEQPERAYDDRTSFERAMEFLEVGEQFLAIAYTDIAGFSARVHHEQKTNGLSSAFKLKEEVDRLLRPSFDTNAAYLKTLGDGCLYLYKDMDAPFHHAVDTQTKLRDFYKSRTDLDPLQVRIGIHAGWVKIVAERVLDRLNKDGFGDAMNLADRVAASCTPGSIRFTEDYRKAVTERSGSQSLSHWPAAKDIGPVKFRGRPDRCHLWEVSVGPQAKSAATKGDLIALGIGGPLGLVAKRVFDKMRS